jgi:hypothetical protein
MQELPEIITKCEGSKNTERTRSGEGGLSLILEKRTTGREIDSHNKTKNRSPKIKNNTKPPLKKKYKR